MKLGIKSKLIKKLKKKLKEEKKYIRKLNNDVIEYHSDIIILDQCNFKLEEEITLLKSNLKEYQAVYLKDSKSSFDKHLDSIMINVGEIHKDDTNFYSNALKYLCGYINALERYSKGDTKKIMEKMKEYKEKTVEAKNALHDIQYGKKSLFKKIDKISREIKGFKNKIEDSI